MPTISAVNHLLPSKCDSAPEFESATILVAINARPKNVNSASSLGTLLKFRALMLRLRTAVRPHWLRLNSIDRTSCCST
jgi:hypothetical protein